MRMSLLLTSVVFAGCAASAGTPATDGGTQATETETETETGDEDGGLHVDDAIFTEIDVGHLTYYSGFDPLEAGEDLALELGAQGLLMFSVDLAATSAQAHEDQTTFGDPFGQTGPLVSAFLDVPDHNVGLDGHFASVSARLHYVFEDGRFVGERIDLVFPDALEPAQIDQRDATLTVRVQQEGGEDLEWVQTIELDDAGYS